MTNKELKSTPAPSASGETLPRKRAAKKATVAKAAAPLAPATKTAAKTTAAKKPARKVTAKTAEVALVVAAAAVGSRGHGEVTAAAPRRTRKVAAESSRNETPDLFATSNMDGHAEAAPAAPARKRRTPAATPDEGSARPADGFGTNPAPAAASPSPAPPAVPHDPAPRRIGRVPGGGAVALRDPSKAARPARKPKTTAAAQLPPPEAAPAPPPPAPVVPPREAPAAPVPTAAQHSHQPAGSNSESRSKRRREKRKQHRSQGQNRHQGQGQAHQGQTHQGQAHQGQGHQGQGHQGQPRHHPQHGEANPNRQDAEANRPHVPTGPKVETNGMLELAPKSFGFLRVPKKNFEQARDDVFVPPELIRRHNLRLGQWIHGVYQEGSRGPQLVEITQVNGMPPDEAAKLPHFDELKAINPTRRLSFETTPDRFTTRVIDIMTPVGRGQRGLIVSPPRSGKTTMLLHTAEAVREKYSDSLHLMVLLVDERPEEVTEFRRALPGAEIYASSNDEVARNHCRIAELAIERAKRLVEAGKDVFLLMDSITRLARAYNATMNNVGRGTGSGGITIGALEVPRRLFAAARNTRGGGSLTILATALIQTNSRADEAIFLEFKGTGNMELVLDRKIAENYIYPAVDIFKSGTRREELLLPEHMLNKIHLIRRGLSGHRPVEAMERLLFFLKKFPNNPQMLLEIKG